MSTISEEEWKTAMFEILEELDVPQYNKMMFFLSDIPKYVKTTKSREEMPEVIIERYGVEASVHKIHEIMDRIPRRDAAVQDRLRPFVERLKKKQEDERRAPGPSTGATGVRALTDGQKHFVDEHRVELIQRVSNIEPILDDLLQEEIIQQEAYDKISALPTSQAKVRELFSSPLKAGDASKEAFYQILKKHEKMLIKDLS
ncbi:apoptosis-associated speck-like protein containing a CARD [Oreochromis niloticus]|uniref:apoptosis-associated speck-like protein containing a CARD n=1 Tax=Oreochromis niloticus TaxID=8128 RepID=UPI0006744EE2|nr:apoptosis-associated speck-like protein containing a CARD [Oreochromis niloticus]